MSINLTKLLQLIFNCFVQFLTDYNFKPIESIDLPTCLCFIC